MTQRHTLLHQIDRTQWPVLFQIVKLHELLPPTYVFDDKRHLRRFKRLLVEDEDEVLYNISPTSSNVNHTPPLVLLSGKSIDYNKFCVSSFGEVVYILDVYHHFPLVIVVLP